MHFLHSYNRLLSRVTAPASEPVSLEEAKHYLRVTMEDDDTLITDLIVSARMSAENWLRRSLMTQAWKLGYDDCLPECVSLPMGPVTAITSVTVINQDQSTQLVGAALYKLNSAKNRLLHTSTVQGFQVEIVYQAGYGGTVSSVPAPIRQAMLCHIASMYDNRGLAGESGMPEQAISLYLPFREVML